MQFFMDNNSVNHYRVLDIYFVMLVTWKLEHTNCTYPICQTNTAVLGTVLIQEELDFTTGHLWRPEGGDGWRHHLGGAHYGRGITGWWRDRTVILLVQEVNRAQAHHGKLQHKGTITTTSQLGFWIWSLFLIIS